MLNLISAVPVSHLHPKSLLQYYANDSSSKLFITVPKFSDLMQQVARNSSTRLHVLDDKLKLNCTLMQVSVTVTSQLFIYIKNLAKQHSRPGGG